PARDDDDLVLRFRVVRGAWWHHHFAVDTIVDALLPGFQLTGARRRRLRLLTPARLVLRPQLRGGRQLLLLVEDRSAPRLRLTLQAGLLLPALGVLALLLFDAFGLFLLAEFRLPGGFLLLALLLGFALFFLALALFLLALLFLFLALLLFGLALQLGLAALLR